MLCTSCEEYECIEGTISTPITEVSALKYVEVAVENIPLKQDQYWGYFGDIPVELIKVDTATIAFFVPPNVTPGTFDLELKFARNKVAFAVVPPLPITNARGYIEDLVSELDSNLEVIQHYYDSLAAERRMEQQLATQISQQLANEQASIETMVKTAADTDIQQAARFIQGYQEELNSIKFEIEAITTSLSASNSRTSATHEVCDIYIGWQRIECLTLKYIHVLTKVRPLAGKIVATTAIGTPFGPEVNALGFVIGAAIWGREVNELFRDAVETYDKIVQETFIPVGNLSLELSELSSGRIQALTYPNRQPVTMPLLLSVRSMNEAQDRRSVVGFVRTFIEAVSDFRAYWNRRVPISLFQFPSPSPVITSKIAPASPEFIDIVVTNNPQVSVNNKASRLNVTFSTDETEDQQFTFRVQYDDGKFVAQSAEQSATLKVERGSIVISIVGGDNQSAEPGDLLPERLAIEARYENGEPVAGLTVAWEIVRGDGEIFNTDIVTSRQGLAYASWLLGEEPVGQQLAGVTAFKDGERVDNAVFSATTQEIDRDLIISNLRVSTKMLTSDAGIFYLTFDFESTSANVVTNNSYFSATLNGFYTSREEYEATIESLGFDWRIKVDSLSNDRKKGTLSIAEATWSGSKSPPSSFYQSYTVMLYSLSEESSNTLTIEF